jgi:polar amino acid transport system permease protein
VLFLVADFVWSAWHNSRFQWSVVRQYLFNHAILEGVRVTIELTIIGMLIGVVLGIVLAVMRLSGNPVMSSISWFYIWFFRGTPLLVQILFWSFAAALYPDVSISIPFGGASLWSESTNTLIPTMTAVILAFGLNEGAYMAEIVRAGIISVDEGQNEAASAIGMSQMQIMRRIVLPQAMRVIIPPTGNEVISMLKNTSLASVVAVGELLYAVQNIYSRTYQEIPLLIVACIWYLAMTSVLYVFQYYLERRYARGSLRNLPPTPIQRLRAFVMRGAPA